MNTVVGKSKQLNRLFTDPDGRLFYLVIPKCGCTYVKNILWHLHHGKPHADPKRVHDSDSSFLRASEVVEQDKDVLGSERAFVILRNPVDRFLSLYFDKVVGDGWRHYVPLRQVLIAHYGLNIDASTTDEHARNCERMVMFLKDNFRDNAHLTPEAHWTRQSDRKNIMRRFDLKVVLTEDLTRHMTILLANIEGNVATAISRSEQYSSARREVGRTVLDKETRKAINQLYIEDRFLYKNARDAWIKIKDGPEALQQIPRYNQIARGS